METRPYHHGHLRAALLAHAEKTLREKGSGALSLRELAREAGVSPAAPSRHFSSKQALLDALALEGFDRLATALTDALAEADDSFAGQLTALTRTYVTFATSNAALNDLMYAFKHDPAASEQLLVATRQLAALPAQLITAGQRRGEVREGSAERLAVPLTATLQGLATLVLSGVVPAERVEETVEDAVTFVLGGCATPTGTMN